MFVHYIIDFRFLRDVVVKFFELDGPREEDIMRTFKPLSELRTSDQVTSDHFKLMSSGSSSGSGSKVRQRPESIEKKV